ncbi:MAG: hypothetical protein RLZZ17_499, partial [Actinomycetota bacterium]
FQECEEDNYMCQGRIKEEGDRCQAKVSEGVPSFRLDADLVVKYAAL